MTNKLIRVAAISGAVSAALLSSACGSSTEGSGGSAGGAAMSAGGADSAGMGDDSIPVVSTAAGANGDTTGGSAAASTQPPAGAVICDSKNVVGTWQAAGTGAASFIVTFESNGKFELYVIAAASDPGAFDVEEFEATYTIAVGVYTTTPTAFSCPSAASAGVSSCYISDGVLIATNLIDKTVSAWAPAKAPSLSNATLGCFLPNNGGFVSYPLTPVP